MKILYGVALALFLCPQILGEEMVSIKRNIYWNRAMQGIKDTVDQLKPAYTFLKQREKIVNLPYVDVPTIQGLDEAIASARWVEKNLQYLKKELGGR